MVSTLVSLVKETAISGFEALRDGIKNAIRELPKIVSDIFEKLDPQFPGGSIMPGNGERILSMD